MKKDEKDAAIRKRQQITKANRSMFITVAVAAAIVGMAVVLITFLVQEMLFNAKVIGAQDKSIATLKENIVNAKTLEDEMRNLQTNSALLSSRANSEDNALRVVLDALPASENTAALGSSLSDKLLNVPGVVVESINIDTIDAITDDVSMETDTTAETGDQTPLPISFSFSVSSDDPNNILTVVQNLEKSIRTINIIAFKVEQNNETMTLTVQAQAFYLPQAEIKLKDEVIKSKENSSSAATEETSGGTN